MHCERVETGGGASAGVDLVYVPGIDGTGELLLRTAERLRAAFRLTRLRYVVDPAIPPGDESYAALAQSAAEVLAPALCGPALLLAESFGGALALQLALDRPERIAGVAVVNGFAHFRKRASLRASRLGQAMLPRVGFELGRRLFGPALLFGALAEPDAVRRFHALAGLSAGAGYRRRLAMIQRLDLRPRLGELSQPVALFASERDRVVAAVPEARELQELLPDATLELLPRAGHVVLPLEAQPWPERLRALAARAGLARPGPDGPGPDAQR